MIIFTVTIIITMKIVKAMIMWVVLFSSWDVCFVLFCVLFFSFLFSSLLSSPLFYMSYGDNNASSSHSAYHNLTLRRKIFHVCTYFLLLHIDTRFRARFRLRICQQEAKQNYTIMTGRGGEVWFTLLYATSIMLSWLFLRSISCQPCRCCEWLQASSKKQRNMQLYVSCCILNSLRAKSYF